MPDRGAGTGNGRLLLQVDAFTDGAFGGNPAAVCFVDGGEVDGWLAAVAGEMNLSETAFVERRGDGWGLRWFTPATEVDLCGHATLAAAHAIWQEQRAAPGEPLRFQTRSGVLTARREDGAIVLDFPAEPAARAEPPAALLGALGSPAVVAVGRNRFDWLLELQSAGAVRSLQPDMAALAAVEMRGVMVTAAADDGAHDFVSRWFGPAVGVPEDPVTGSAHCCLGPWWAGRLGRSILRGYQASARGGSVGVRVSGERVELVGRAVTVLRGWLLV
jgi:PhzF family phenazine biosynthesis protein